MLPVPGACHAGPVSRPLALLATWLLATAVATALAWVAVREVTADVLPGPAVPVTVPGAPPASAGPDPTAPAEALQTVDLVGGSVTVRYGQGTTDLVSHTVAPGFTAELRATGPQRVDLRFRSDDHESRIVIDQEGGAPRVRPEEDDD
jgi:hypothetical protein